MSGSDKKTEPHDRDEARQEEETSHKTHAYERMLERLREPREGGEPGWPDLQARLHHAKEQAVHLGELTRQEAEEVAAYVRRDLHDAAEYVRKSRTQISDWLRFDLAYLEDRLAQLFGSTVDEARAELKHWQSTGELVREWHTGEVAAPGTFYCQTCGQEIRLRQTAHLPPCPKCQGTVFGRPEHPAEA